MSDRQTDPSADLAAFLVLRACSTLDRRAWAEDAARLAQAGPEDWRQVALLARYHGLGGHVASCLAGAEQVPPALLDDLKRWSMARLEIQLRRRPAIARAVDAMEAAQLPVILFKGYALAEEIYGSLAARSFGDGDLLVRRADHARAERILEDLGFTHRFVDPPPHALHGTELSLGEAVVDLHWQLFDADPPGFEARIWADARPPLGRGRLPGLRLAPELALLHLADHFCHHDFLALKPLVDLYVVAHRLEAEIDPDRLRRLAARLGLAGALDLSLLVCKTHFRPSTAIDRLAVDRPSFRVRRATAALTARRLLAQQSNPTARWFVAFHRRLATQRPVEVARWLRHWVIPNQAFLETRFGTRFHWTDYPRYYAIQLSRLILRSKSAFKDKIL